jgi:hypothetical protein
MRTRSWATAFALSIILTTPLVAKEYLSPKAKSGERVVRKACVMPAEVELAKAGIKGSEGMTTESDRFAEDVRSLVAKKLADRGVEVNETELGSAALASNEDLRQLVLGVQRKYDTVAPQMHKKPKDIRKGRFTLGDEVALLPTAASVDTIVFVHGRGTMLTGGKKAFGILVGGASSDSSGVNVTFVDAKSGEVISMVTLASVGGNADDPFAGYSKNMTKAFSKLPMGTGAK